MKTKLIRIRQFHVLLIEADGCVRAFHKLDSKLVGDESVILNSMALKAEKEKRLFNWKERVIKHINENTREYADEHFLLEREQPYKTIKEVEKHLKPSLIKRVIGAFNG